MNVRIQWLPRLLTTAALFVVGGLVAPLAYADLPVSQTPLPVGSGQTAAPLNMLVLGRDHKLYYEAYNDASDLNGDGVLDIGYKGYLSADNGGIDYFGYFDSHRCYTYSSANGRFVPGGATGANKTCSNAWSGDFLNYLTTSRMDAVRKVLYGGYRSTDTATLTVLERAYIPQESHSWGKKYTSTAVDGYNISNYAPLSQPAANKHHLFTNVTLLQNEASGPRGVAGIPLLRVLNDTTWQVWDWSGRWSSDTGVSSLNCGTSSANSCTGSAPHPGHPANLAAFNALETTYATAANQMGGTYTAVSVNCANNDCNKGGDDNNYLTIAEAKFHLADNAGAAGNYEFCIDGDDAVDARIYNESNGSLLGTTSNYGSHDFEGAVGDCTGSTSTGNIALARNGKYSIKVRHEDGDGGDGYRLQWRKISGNSTFAWKVFARDNNGNTNVKRTAVSADNTDFTFKFYNLTPASSAITDYTVRVEVCDQAAEGCKLYPNGRYKPVGILHDYGESGKMMFGLLTGSYANNTQGGVLRRNLSDFSDEINAENGTFKTDVVGIAKTIDRFRTINLANDHTYSIDCGVTSPNRGWVNNRSIKSGECLMWGNPIAEMMYETLRYFAGAGAPTTQYNIANNATDSQAPLSLPKATWEKPYFKGEGGGNGGQGYLRCATPVMTVISDINPSYEDDLPGSNWASADWDGDGVVSATGNPAPLNSLNVATVADSIWNAEGYGTKTIFIGEAGGVANNVPSPKTASNFSTIRGLSPEEPSKRGTYYSAAIAKFGASNPIGGQKKVLTYSVALSSPLPSLKFDVGGKPVTVVPFAKSTSGTWGGTIDTNGDFQPTNQIVDYYVEEYSENRVVFSINYEDTEQGADHDLDAVTRYTFEVLDGKLKVTLNSTFAAGGIHQYMGYVISGTTKDGVYIDVKDSDTGTPVSYKFNTPQGKDPGYCDRPAASRPADCNQLGLTSVREFTPSSSGAAEVLPNPLWFAAKHGRPSDILWDADNDGNPDNYFLVTNAGELKSQLDKAFAQILTDVQASGGVAASGARATADFMAYVPEYNTTDWTGDLKSYRLKANGSLEDDPIWSAKQKLSTLSDDDVKTQAGRKLYYIDADGQLQDFTYSGLGTTADEVATALGFASASAVTTKYPGKSVQDVVNYLRGDRSNHGVFRTRSGRIGDIFGSQPAVLDKASYGYLNLPSSWGGGTGAGKYAKFVEDKEDRTSVVFVGANDGFLHAFDATSGANGGEELFAIAPSSVLANMGQLADPAYTHRYFLDGTPTQGDAYIGGSWKTILLFGQGAGGRSIVALDVTDAANDAAPQVLWEFTDPDLGLTIGQPKIGVLNDGTWAAIFGNGYNSDNNQAFLFVVNLETGELVQKIQAGDEGTDDTPNALSTPAIIDLNFDGITDIVYAGDYYGNLWKFDLSGTGTQLPRTIAWASLEPQKLFTATDSDDGERQHITGGVTAGIHPVNGQMVFFGTGKYFLIGDNAAPTVDDQVESFYGIWDKPSGSYPIDRDALTEQTFSTDENGRTSTSYTVDWANSRGWFIDLKANEENTPVMGERFIGQPTVALGRVVFTTYATQSGDECEPSGSNWIHLLCMTNGGGDCGGSSQLNQSVNPITGAVTIVTSRQGGDSGQNPDDDDDGGGGDEGGGDTGGGGDDDDPEPPSPVGMGTPEACIVNVDLLTAVGLQPLLKLHCGRQSWRMIESE